MICNSARALVVKHLSHLLGCRPSGYEVDTVLERVEGRTNHPGELERIAREEAARNLFDYVELERLESEFGLEFISVSQPTENTPAGRIQRRMLASMASFYTEQQSLDVREGLARRVKEGWFVGHAPYGYRNVRIDGRGVVEIDPVNGPKIKRLFDLFAYHGLTLDMLIERLAAACADPGANRPASQPPALGGD